VGRINDRRRDHLAEAGNEAASALDLLTDFDIAQDTSIAAAA
jgi:hypothetical protein